RIAVHVERRLEFARLAESAARAIDRSRGRVDEGDAPRLAPVEQLERVAVVVLHHVAAVGLHGVGARALVQHRANLSADPVAADALEEILLVEVIRDLAIGEVGHLVRARQVVDRDDVPDAARIERLHQVRPDESCRPRDDHRHADSPEWSARLASSSARVATAVPSLRTTIPAAWLATRIAACRFAPAATINARTPITVSPAPLTSYTSRAFVDSCQ